MTPEPRYAVITQVVVELDITSWDADPIVYLDCVSGIRPTHAEVAIGGPDDGHVYVGGEVLPGSTDLTLSTWSSWGPTARGEEWPAVAIEAVAAARAQVRVDSGTPEAVETASAPLTPHCY